MSNGFRVHSFAQTPFQPIEAAVYYTTNIGDYLCREYELPAETGARLNRQLEACALTGTDPIDFYLPMLRRRQWSRRSEVLTGAQLVSLPEGALALETGIAHTLQASAVAAIASTEGANMDGLRLYQSIRRILPFGSMYHLLSWLGIEVPGIGSHQMVDAAIRITSPAEAFAAWFKTPPPRTKGRFDAFRSVTRAVQEGFRAWLPFFALTGIDNYLNAKQVRTLAVYCTSMTLGARSRTEFGRDVYDRRTVQKVYGAGKVRRDGELNRIRAMLVAAGRTDAVRAYSPRPLRSPLESVQLEGRAVLPFIQAETLMFDLVTTFGEKWTAARKAGVDCVKAFRTVPDEFALALQRPFRQIWANNSYPEMAPLILWSATRALSTELGQPIDLRISVEVIDEHGKRHAGQKSGANFPAQNPLSLQEIAS